MKRWIIIVMWLLPTFSMAQQYSLIDKNANAATKALHQNLHIISSKGILFGHQHATEYGHGWRGDENRSDVKSVTGQHPAVIGIDFSGLSGKSEADIEKEKALLKKNIEDTYNRGGITTVAWHFSNPISGGGFYWKDSVSLPAVPYLLPGAAHHDTYKKILQTIAELAKEVKGKDGVNVPMIFRPYHEMDGDWFWWGKPYCSSEDFIGLWRFTVTYLRDSLNVHNFIYAFSPDNLFSSEKEFTERYPGNEWVDMVGMDNYGDWGRYGKYDIAAGIKKLQIVDAFAKKNRKLAAFTETGLESVANNKWYSEILLQHLKKAKVNLCYVLVWRNDETSTTHYYAPFPNHPAVPDFLKFFHDPYTLFEKDLPNMYQ